MHLMGTLSNITETETIFFLIQLLLLYYIPFKWSIGFSEEGAKIFI